MSITSRRLTDGKLSWGYQFSIGGRENRQQYKQGGFRTRKEAELAEAEERLRAARLPVPTANPKSLAQVLAAFIEDRKHEWSPKTAARYEELAGHIAAELRSKPVAEITALALHLEWKRLSGAVWLTRGGRERPYSAKTVRNIAGLVSGAYGWAILYGLCTVNPCRDSKPPRGGAKRKTLALSPQQVDLMIAAAGGPWCLPAFLEVEAGLGARRGEVLALRWSDISGGYVTIGRSLGQVEATTYFKSTKTDKIRRIEIPARSLEVLEAHRREQQKHRDQFGADYRTDLDLIFATPEGEVLKPDSVSAAVSKLCRRLKLPKGANLHALRHSHGSQLIAGGVPIPEVSARLGHSSPATTMTIYAHEVPGKGEAAKRWEEIQGEAPKEKRQ